MAIHRFVVNVPNPSEVRISVDLYLQQEDISVLSMNQVRNLRTSLEVVKAGISLNPCESGEEQRLTLTLERYTSVDVFITIETAGQSSPAAAALSLVDRRDGKNVGGVVLVCADPAILSPAGQVIPASKPCPAVLATELYAIRLGGDPTECPLHARTPVGATMELVAQVTNPSEEPLAGTEIYLEHLGASGAEFTPGTWNAGTLAPRQVFFAAWPIRTKRWRTGTFDTSIVVVSQGMEPVRLKGKITLAADDEETASGVT